MQVLILAAGYGTRLYPLTLNTPKPLLPCGKKPIINFLLDKVKDFRGLTRVVVITNDRFYKNFDDWAKENKSFKVPIVVLNDGTTTPEDRLGAIGDIDFTLKKYGLKEDLLVMGGDNLFDYSLNDYIVACGKNSPKATIGLYDLGDTESAKKFGVVQLDSTNKIISFEEKPAAPKSTLIGMCLYYLPKDSLAFISKYLKETKKSDTTGDYINWLSQHEGVYGFAFKGKWFDIGSIEAYNQAQKDFKS